MDSDMSSLPAVAPAAPIRLTSIQAAVRMMNARDDTPADPVARCRRMVADLCRVLGDEFARPRGDETRARAPAQDISPAGGPYDSKPFVSLSPRTRQTLELLLAGDSEKEIAARLRLSPHTVHVYVKSLYRRFDVCSRGELCAKFIDPRAPSPRQPAAKAPSATVAVT